jgi:hypothetical protein
MMRRFILGLVTLVIFASCSTASSTAGNETNQANNDQRAPDQRNPTGQVGQNFKIISHSRY